MSRTDYLRPAWYQVQQVARCGTCGREADFSADQAVDGARCTCGGRWSVIGESYPASSDDWDEERDRVDGEWRPRR
jgi:DNA-directed RNA polymerase subunit RPC12/RpoP